MPRTPLLQRLLRALHSSRETHARTLEVRSMAPSRELTRRATMLGGVALGLHAAGCHGPAAAKFGAAHVPVKTAGGPGSVVVVGGGTAGLTCAYRLLAGGVPCEVLEASNRLGGRVFSDRSTFGGLTAELGGEFIDTGHEHLRTLAQELGLELDDLKATDDGLHALYDFGGRIYEEEEVATALRPLAPVVAKELEQLGDPEVPYMARGFFRERDQWSIARWLEERAVNGIGRHLLELAFTTELGLDADQLSCIPMLQMLGLGDTFALYGESDERYRVKGGNSRVSEELGRRLDGRITLGAALEAAKRRADGRVTLTFRKDGGTIERVAERVVFALPFSILRHLALDDSLRLSPRKVRSIKELGYGTNAKLTLGYASRKWRESKRSGELFTDRPYQSTWETTRAQPGTAGILTVFTGGKGGEALGQGPSESQRDACAAAIESALVGTRAELTMAHARFDWPNHPFVRASYSTWKVGQLTAFGGVESEVEADVLHFAGEHTSLTAQGYMEGAVESGNRAAKEVLVELAAGARAGPWHRGAS